MINLTSRNLGTDKELHAFETRRRQMLFELKLLDFCLKNHTEELQHLIPSFDFYAYVMGNVAVDAVEWCDEEIRLIKRRIIRLCPDISKH